MGFAALHCCQGMGELLPHRFTLTWEHLRSSQVNPSGLLSVALSVGFPRLAVSQHHALRSPDFPPVSYEASKTPLKKRAITCSPP